MLTKDSIINIHPIPKVAKGSFPWQGCSLIMQVGNPGCEVVTLVERLFVAHVKLLLFYFHVLLDKVPCYERSCSGSCVA